MNRKTETIILCEDRQQDYLVRNLLKAKGRLEGKIYPDISPGGDGKAYVRERYPIQLDALRKSNVNAELVVVIDGDSDGVEERQKQLANSCRSRNIDPRKSEDKVAVFVPTRCIETWIYYLNDMKVDGKRVDEQLEYPCKEGKRKLARESDCKPAPQRLAELYRAYRESHTNDKPPPATLPSLLAACQELDRVFGDGHK